MIRRTAFSLAIILWISTISAPALGTPDGPQLDLLQRREVGGCASFNIAIEYDPASVAAIPGTDLAAVLVDGQAGDACAETLEVHTVDLSGTTATVVAEHELGLRGIARVADMDVTADAVFVLGNRDQAFASNEAVVLSVIDLATGAVTQTTVAEEDTGGVSVVGVGIGVGADGRGRLAWNRVVNRGQDGVDTTTFSAPFDGATLGATTEHAVTDVSTVLEAPVDVGPAGHTVVALAQNTDGNPFLSVSSWGPTGAPMLVDEPFGRGHPTTSFPIVLADGSFVLRLDTNNETDNGTGGIFAPDGTLQVRNDPREQSLGLAGVAVGDGFAFSSIGRDSSEQRVAGVNRWTSDLQQIGGFTPVGEDPWSACCASPAISRVDDQGKVLVGYAIEGASPEDGRIAFRYDVLGDVPVPPTEPADPDQAVVAAAVAISEQRFADASGAFTDAAFAGEGALASWGVIARTGVFADSLSGSGLTATGPMLFTAPDVMDAATLAELQRVLSDGDRVFLLGGTGALSTAIEDAVVAAGFVPVRLAGPSRIETSLAIAQQIRDIGGSGRIVLARADGPADNPTAAWADSVTAGAWAAQESVAVVLTPSTSLHPAVQQRLAEQQPETTYLLGGPAAISESTATAVAETTGTPPVRIQGQNRYETAAAITTQLWGDAASGGYLVTSGNAELGWAYGLAAAGLGAQLDRPLLLVETDRLPAETDAVLCATGVRAEVTVVGGTEIVSNAVRDALAAPC